ncbi:hypothetical protein E2562_006476 [Oryza meyeriana var. granulata]|uniref:Uncharacterized protein n=1 Tax=Oryza meyeriana var. granulata TaxID=110450 RepID=A0A6G1CP60_9ORYZ|nr:hypothetical protein E2562_006476 [Oryza meyeriana var. granulata]
MANVRRRYGQHAPWHDTTTGMRRHISRGRFQGTAEAGVAQRGVAVARRSCGRRGVVCLPGVIYDRHSRRRLPFSLWRTFTPRSASTGDSKSAMELCAAYAT